MEKGSAGVRAEAAETSIGSPRSSGAKVVGGCGQAQAHAMTSTHLVPRPVPYSAMRAMSQGLLHIEARNSWMLVPIAVTWRGKSDAVKTIAQLVAHRFTDPPTGGSGVRIARLVPSGRRTFKSSDGAARCRPVQHEPPDVCADVHDERRGPRPPRRRPRKLQGARRHGGAQCVQELLHFLLNGGTGVEESVQDMESVR